MCKSNELTSLCILEVKKGEERPVITFDENVEGPVSRPISFEVPYKGTVTVKIMYLYIYSEYQIIIYTNFQ